VSDASFDPTEGEGEGEVNSFLQVYVAGASAEMERAEGWMRKLREAGITVTSTWPDVIRKVGAANPMDAPRADRLGWAIDDVRQVVESNVFWLLLPQGKVSAGAYTELGCAIAMTLFSKQAELAGLPAAPYKILVSGVETSIFTALGTHATTDEEAFNSLVAFEAALLEDERRSINAQQAAEAGFSPEMARQLDDIFKPK